MKNKYKTIKRLDDRKRRGVSLMTDIKLKFPEIDQTYTFLDLQTTDKGTVRQNYW